MLHDGRAIRVAVVGGSRIPFSRSHSIYRHCSNHDLLTAALEGLVNRLDLRGQALGDVAVGAVLKHSRDWNLARECVIESGLSMRTPAYDLQRACGTSVEAAIQIANKIALGQIESGIAGGTDTLSDAPIVLPDPYRRRPPGPGLPGNPRARSPQNAARAAGESPSSPPLGSTRPAP